MYIFIFILSLLSIQRGCALSEEVVDLIIVPAVKYIQFKHSEECRNYQGVYNLYAASCDHGVYESECRMPFCYSCEEARRIAKEYHQTLLYFMGVIHESDLKDLADRIAYLHHAVIKGEWYEDTQIYDFLRADHFNEPSIKKLSPSQKRREKKRLQKVNKEESYRALLFRFEQLKTIVFAMEFLSNFAYKDILDNELFIRNGKWSFAAFLEAFSSEEKRDELYRLIETFEGLVNRLENRKATLKILSARRSKVDAEETWHEVSKKIKEVDTVVHGLHILIKKMTTLGIYSDKKKGAVKMNMLIGKVIEHFKQRLMAYLALNPSSKFHTCASKQQWLKSKEFSNKLKHRSQTLAKLILLSKDFLTEDEKLIRIETVSFEGQDEIKLSGSYEMLPEEVYLYEDVAV